MCLLRCRSSSWNWKPALLELYCSFRSQIGRRIMFNRKCSVIGVIHTLPLPGAAGWGGNIDEVLRWAVGDALEYKEHGVDALMIENMHDVPYLKGYVDPE